MRDLVRQLLGEKISRRGFVTGMLAAGYSSTAALSALQSVEPFTGGVSPTATRTVTGTGAELMADQIIETGAEYVFVSNGSGLGPLCDAMVDRPQLPADSVDARGSGRRDRIGLCDGLRQARFLHVQPRGPAALHLQYVQRHEGPRPSGGPG